jgi:hypothetical protein
MILNVAIPNQLTRMKLLHFLTLEQILTLNEPVRCVMFKGVVTGGGAKLIV